MMIDLTTTTAATQAARIGVPAYVVACPTSVTIEPAAGERAVAPTAVKSRGHVRLIDDATGFAGSPAWSPPPT